MKTIIRKLLRSQLTKLPKGGFFCIPIGCGPELLTVTWDPTTIKGNAQRYSMSVVVNKGFVLHSFPTFVADTPQIWSLPEPLSTAQFSTVEIVFRRVGRTGRSAPAWSYPDISTVQRDYLNS